MKIFVVTVLAACAVAAYGETADSIKQYQKECMAENGLDSTDKSPDNLTVEDGNCYFACFYKKFGIMKEDGSYDIAAIKNKFSKPNPLEAVQKKVDDITEKYCKDKVGNYCNLAACLYKVPKEQWKI